MDHVLRKKSYTFAIEIVRLYKQLITGEHEYVLSKQMLRSGTSIGEMVKEAEHAQSKKDFLNKMNVALKEANETEYWLMLLKDSSFITVEVYYTYNISCNELIRILISIVKSTKRSLGISTSNPENF